MPHYCPLVAPGDTLVPETSLWLGGHHYPCNGFCISSPRRGSSGFLLLLCWTGLVCCCVSGRQLLPGLLPGEWLSLGSRRTSWPVVFAGAAALLLFGLG